MGRFRLSGMIRRRSFSPSQAASRQGTSASAFSLCGLSRHFRHWTIDQTQLLPAAVVDYVRADHLAQFVVALAREHLDLSEIVASYKSGLGQPPFDPRMMTALLLYAYCSGLYSSRRIANACAERVDFMMIVAHDAPDFRTIADFRKRHLPALGRLFLQALKLAEKAGLAKLGHVALDGTKIKANASEHKAMKIHAYVATGRAKHPAETTRKVGGEMTQTMRQKLKRAGYRSRYRLRKQIVVPVFGQIKQARGFRQFLLRGLEAVQAEWALICTTHNIIKVAKAI